MITLVFALTSFVIIIILNKKLIRTKKDIENYDDKIQISIIQKLSDEFEAPLSTIIELIDKLKSTLGSNIDMDCLVDFDMLYSQSEKLKSLIERNTSLINFKDSTDNNDIEFGNLISFYQYLFESHSDLAQEKKIDFLFYSNIRVLNLNYYPDYLRRIFDNLIVKLLKDCSEGDKVKIEVILDKNIKHYKLKFTSSYFLDYQPSHIESDLTILTTKSIINRLNGSFKIAHSNKGKIIYYVNLPLSNELNKQPIGCLTIHKPIKFEVKYEIISESESESETESETEFNNIKTNVDPDYLNRITSIIYRDIANTDNTIEMISSELCISSSQLNRRIKFMTGMTTSQFILKTRLNRAKNRLAITQKPIGEVAMECGFNDFAYFSRSFKKEFEMTPTTFQRIQHSIK